MDGADARRVPLDHGPARGRPRRPGRDRDRLRPLVLRRWRQRGPRRPRRARRLRPGPARRGGQPGYGVRPELDHDLAWHVGPAPTRDRRRQRRLRGHRPRPGLLLRPPLRGATRQAHHRRAQARPARRVRAVVGAAPAGRRHPRRRPPPVRADRDRRRDRRHGPVQRRRPRRRRSPTRAPRHGGWPSASRPRRSPRPSASSTTICCATTSAPRSSVRSCCSTS